MQNLKMRQIVANELNKIREGEIILKISAFNKPNQWESIIIFTLCRPMYFPHIQTKSEDSNR